MVEMVTPTTAERPQVSERGKKSLRISNFMCLTFVNFSLPLKEDDI